MLTWVLSCMISRSLDIVFCPFDQQPQHKHQLTEKYREEYLVKSSVVMREEDPGKAQHYVNNPVDEQPDAQEARNKS